MKGADATDVSLLLNMLHFLHVQLGNVGAVTQLDCRKVATNGYIFSNRIIHHLVIRKLQIDWAVKSR